MRSRRAAAGGAWVIVLVAALVLAAVGFVIYRVVKHREPKPAAEKVEWWTCSMHPQVRLPHPGNCPICGMELVPVEEKKQPKEAAAAGPGGVEIDPAKQQLIGVVTTAVERRRLERVVRTVGRVTVDESGLSEVHTKVEGWVERLYANETGKLVRRGQPLLTIYSPELVSTQEEYLVALRSRDRMARSPFVEVQRSGESLLEAARERLRRWDVSEEQISRLEGTGEAQRTVTLYAPATGYVMEKMAVEGMRVMPEMTLYRLADLSRVWVEADVYEYEAPLVRAGERARVTLQSAPGRALEGRVSYVYPTVEAMTRTLKARIEFANPGLELKPEMYADVEIMAPGEETLAVPEQAVVDTGTRKVVFVKKGEGTFEPREVSLGPRAAGYYPVLSGVQEGELVVSSPNFLLDSESRLQEGMQGMAGMAGMEGMKSGASSQAGHGQ